MGDKHALENISGNELMNKEERAFFNRYSSALEEQEKSLAEQEDLEIGSYSLNKLLRELENNKEEYIVCGAPLKCSNATDETRYIYYQGEKIESRPMLVDMRSRLWIHEERQESVNNLIPAGIKDCRGGMRDDVAKDLRVNIIGFGNCKMIENNAKLEDLITIRHPVKQTLKCEEIKQALEAGMGTCYCFMQLNEEWENLALAGEYMTGMFDSLYGTNSVLSPPYMKFNGIEGINMLSMLYCHSKQGVITAKESGQKMQIVTGVSDRLIELLKSYETGLDKDGKYLPQGEPALSTYQGEGDDMGVHTTGWGYAMQNYEEGWYEFSDGTRINLYPIGTEITREQAEELLEDEINDTEDIMNEVLEKSGIATQVNQQFYDALFMLVYQNGTGHIDMILKEKWDDDNSTDLEEFLRSENFDPVNAKEIMEQFGDYTNGGQAGTMKRRADEIDIILYDDYVREDDETRYGDIWAKKSKPNEVTKGYENIE